MSKLQVDQLSKTSAGADTFVLPAADGTVGQYVKTDGSGALSFGTPSGGKVLQVVSATYDTETSTTGGAFIDSGLNLSITPSAASSKVFVMMFVKTTGQAASSYYTGKVGLQLIKDSSIILGPWNTGISGTGTSAAVMQMQNWNTITYLDSPSTTSSTNYKLQFKNTNQQAWIQADGETSVITLMEVGA